MNNGSYVSPEYGKDGFTCPNCQAYAHQQWNEIFKTNEYQASFALSRDLRLKRDITESLEIAVEESEMVDLVFSNSAVNKYLIDNTIALSSCSRCSKESFWFDGKLIFPNNSVAPSPHSDMPEEVKEVYNEARAILDFSPRASAALLRLALEKLLPLVGAEGKDINSMIGDLVSKGLPEEMQKATDGLRIVGNESIHPGTIKIEDNKEVSEILFEILNFIVGRLITEKKRIKKIYDLIPDNKINGIKQRDSVNNK